MEAEMWSVSVGVVYQVLQCL